jgi:hypothetical protein
VELVGDAELRVTLRKPISLRNSSGGSPRGPRKGPPTDPANPCKVLDTLEVMANIAMLVFVNLLGEEHEAEEENDYQFEIVPERDVAKLSQKSLCVPVIDSVYQRFPALPVKTDDQVGSIVPIVYSSQRTRKANLPSPG